jgi:uncharacterized protein YbjT (DUF2867 family)
MTEAARRCEEQSMIYVSGAPGIVALDLVRRLSQQGEHVRVLVPTAKDIGLSGLPRVEVVVGDLHDAPSFEETLTGVDSVFVSSTLGATLRAHSNLISTAESGIRAQKSLVGAALRAGVRHVVKLSWMGASDAAVRLPTARWHAEVESHLQGSGVPFTILRANNFMQHYLRSITHADENTLLGAAGEGRCSLVDARDVAAVAAHVLTEAGHEGKIYEITGPQALTRAEAAAVIADVTGREIHYVEHSLEELSAIYQYVGWPSRWADELVAADELQALGLLSAVTDVVERMTGKRPTTFEEFVREAYAADGSPTGGG